MSLSKPAAPSRFLEDALEVDPEYPNDRFVGISFISPENILKRREIFFFEKFVDSWDFVKSMKKFSDFLYFMSEKYNLKLDVLQKDYQDFLREEEKTLKEASVLDDYKNFLDANEDNLMDQFNKENDFQTSVRGIKIRTPTCRTAEEVEIHVKKIRERDPHNDIYIGEVGKWMPFEPNAYKTGRTEFLEPELNELYHNKLKNEALAKEEFEKRVYEAKRKAIEENIEKAKKTGNKLTQTIDAEGNLIGVMQTVNFEEREVATEEAIEQNRRETFERHRMLEKSNPMVAETRPPNP